MIYLYGAGGHGKVVLDILIENDVQVGGFFDDDDKRIIASFTAKHFPDGFNRDNDKLIITIGNNQVRKSKAENVDAVFAKAVHPSAVVSKKAIINDGTAVMPLAVINADSIIGTHCIINSGAIIEHDCVIEDFVHIAPNVTLCGGIRVGQGSLIGAGAVILPGITVGRWAVVGAGAVVTKNVADGITVAGNPASKTRRV